MIKAAIWGAGYIAATHAESLRGLGIPIHVVVDRNADKARDFAQRWGIPHWSQQPEELFSDQVACVHLCTPPNLHYEMACRLLEAGKHILCEKPLCFSNTEADTLARLAREKGLVCGVNFNVRFHQACQQAKKLVDSPDFGRVLLIHGSYLQEFSAPPSLRDWRYDPKLAGEMHAVTEIGSHWMDIAQYISGKRITAVSALFDRSYPIRYQEGNLLYGEPAPGRELFPVQSEEAAMVNLRFQGGAIGSMVLSEISQGRYNALSLEVTGEKQNLWWNAEQNNLLCHARKGGTVESNVFAFGNGFTDTFRSLAAAFYEDVLQGKPSEHPVYPTFEDGRNNVLLSNAILASARQDSKWVQVAQKEEEA